jgi:hypothetical protein
MAVATLGEAMNLSWRITMRCAWGKRDAMKSVRECTYRRELDMATLVATRGRDFPLAGLEQRLRCPRCGSARSRSCSRCRSIRCRISRLNELGDGRGSEEN